MIKIAFLSLILLTNHLYAQNVKASYIQTFDYDFVESRMIDLYIDAETNKSVQVAYAETPDDDTQSTAELSPKVNATIARKSGHDYIFTDLNNKTIDIYKDFARTFYKVNDVFPEIHWQLLPDKKDIEGIEVQKAIGTYRGKNWEAWYSPSIPYSFGPWKFTGLPGLVISVKDDTSNNFFQLKKLAYNKTCDICEVSENIHDAEISLKEFLEIQDEVLNSPLRNLPRDVIVVGNKVNFLNLETEFEFDIEFSWEKNNK